MTPFFRLSGGGNDFLALVEPKAMPTSEDIAAWCRRGISLGADGVFVLARTDAGARMDYHNADGQPAALCVNGTRCAARLAFHLGWAENTIDVTTGAGVVPARATGETEVELELFPPESAPRAVDIELAERDLSGSFIVFGVPHYVVFGEAPLTGIPVERWGKEARQHPAFAPHGANIDFVRLLSPSEIEIRTFERGVEAETLACGTGVLAAAACAETANALAGPLRATTRGGFVFTITPPSASTGWRLAGDARILATGNLLPEASARVGG